MARWPPPSPPDGEHSFGHEAIALSFFVACVAATVVLVSSMCSACGRKPKAASPAPDAAASVSDVNAESQTTGDDGEEEKPVVTLSPELATHGPIAPVALPASTSKRRMSMTMSLSKNLSMNIPDKMRLSRRERRDKVEPEDTLWKKAIILGEKCKIPGEREGECDADADELAAGSFRRSSYSRPMSRSSSFAVHQHDAPPAAAASNAASHS
ncbi:hypothetical protein E2562_004771 [Oryza meyeriana var. granulata]|uniref:Uncharacterized protein n=1 Tax=Oryza meyeriana var. granulata TaxID=110450 RepID=A0A6G1DF59_9ORYZ|nr:hypothetical protein E2562_004771 [Oryza meyeriana var. granulata]